MVSERDGPDPGCVVGWGKKGARRARRHAAFDVRKEGSGMDMCWICL